MRSQSAFFLMMAISGLALAATATTSTTNGDKSALDMPTVQCVDLETNTVVKEGSVEQKMEGNEVVLFDRTPQGPEASQEVAAAPTTAPAVAPAPTAVTATKTTVAAAPKKARKKTVTRKTLSITPAGSGVTDIVPVEGSTVRLVPVAKPGYISGVTSTGETVMIPLGTTQPQVVTALEKDIKTELRVTGRSFLNSQGKAIVVVPVAKPGYISGVTAAGEIVMIPTGATAKTEVTSAQLVASTAPMAPAQTTTTTTTTVVKAPASAAPASEAASDATLEQEVAAAETTTAATTEASAAGTNTQSSTTRVVKYTTVPAKKAYAQLVAGLGGYPEVSNVNSGYDITGAVGYYYNNYMFEAGAGLAKYSMDVRNYSFFNKTDNFDIDQYRAHLAAKYRFDKGAMGMTNRWQPIAGALLTYTQRRYNLTNPAMTTPNASGNTGSSTAVDAGLNAGLDYEFSPDYAIGFDFKYMFNLSNEVDANYANPNAGYTGTPIEQLQYYIAGISAKINF